jgi:Domain of unknown function (DUF4168)
MLYKYTLKVIPTEEVRMLKQFLMGGSALILLATVSPSALAGSPESKPQASPVQQTPETSTPQAQPAPQAQPQSEAQPATPQAKQVSSQELQQVAKVVPKLVALDQTAQQKISQAIAQSGIGMERFRELYRAERSPGATVAKQPTQKERESYSKTLSQIQLIGKDTQSQQEQLVRASGLEPTRFGEILVAVQQDPALRQQMQKLTQPQ